MTAAFPSKSNILNDLNTCIKFYWTKVPNYFPTVLPCRSRLQFMNLWSTNYIQDFIYVSRIVLCGTIYVLLLNTFLREWAASTSILPFLKLLWVTWKYVLWLLAGLTKVVTFSLLVKQICILSPARASQYPMCQMQWL